MPNWRLETTVCKNLFSRVFWRRLYRRYTRCQGLFRCKQRQATLQTPEIKQKTVTDRTVGSLETRPSPLSVSVQSVCNFCSVGLVSTRPSDAAAGSLSVRTEGETSIGLRSCWPAVTRRTYWRWVVDSLRLTPSCPSLFTVYFVVNSAGLRSFWTSRHLVVPRVPFEGCAAFKSNKAARILRT